MIWILLAIVVIVFGLVIRAGQQQTKSMREIENSVARIEKLALENERLASEVRKKFEKV